MNSQKSAGTNPKAVPVAGEGGGGDPIIYQGFMFSGGAVGRGNAASFICFLILLLLRR